MRRFVFLLFVILLCIACGSKTPSHNTALAAQHQYHEAATIEKSETILRAGNSVYDQYLLATLLDETGRAKQAMHMYLEVLNEAYEQKEYQYETLASAIAIISLRGRVKDFAAIVTPLIEKLVSHCTVSKNQAKSIETNLFRFETIYQLKNLYFSFALQKGEKNEANHRLQQSGCVTPWKIAGPFVPNIDNKDMKTTIWPSQTHLGPGRPVIDVKEHILSVCQVQSPPSWAPSNGILWAKTTLHSKKTKPVFLRLATSQSTKLFVDGKLRYSQDANQNRLPEVRWLSITAPRGASEISIQTTSEQFTPYFSLVAVNEYGDPLQFDTQEKGFYPQNSNIAINALDLPKAQNPSQMVSALKVALWNDNAYEAHNQQNKILSNGGDKNPIHQLLSIDRIQHSPFISPEIGYAQSVDICRRLLKRHPRLYRCAVLVAKNEYSEGRTSNALQVLSENSNFSPNEISILFAQMEIYNDQKWHQAALDTLSRIKILVGENCRVLQWSYLLALGRKDYDSAMEAAKQVNKCNSTSQVYATELARRNNHNKAANELGKIHALIKDVPQTAIDYAQALFFADAKKKAIDILKQTVEQFPLVAKPRDMLFDAYIATDQLPKAQQLIDETTRFPSTHAETQRYQQLSSKDALAPYRVDGNQIVKDHLLASRLPVDVGLEWILDRMVHIIDVFGSRFQITHWIGRIHTVEALEQHTEIEVPFNAQILNIRTIKPDGTAIYPVLIENKNTISMSNTSVGDFIEFETVSYFPPSAVYPGGVDTDRFYFQDFESRFVRSEMVVAAPKQTKLQYDTRGDSPIAQETLIDNVQVVTFRARNIMPKTIESASPVAAEFLPSIRVTANASYAALCQHYSNQLSLAHSHDPTLQKFVQQNKYIVNKNDNRPKQEQLFDWVLEHILNENSITDDPSHILSRGKGSRIRLYQALLAQMNISSEIGLVIPSWEDHTVTDIPDNSRMSSTVLKLEDETVLYFEEDFTPFAYLPAFLNNQPVLYLPNCEQTKTTRGKTKDNSTRINADIHIQSNGSAIGTISQTVSGQNAIYARQLLSSSKANTKMIFEEKILPVLLPTATLETVTIKKLYEKEIPLVFEYRISLPGLVTKTERNAHFSMPFENQWSEFSQGTPQRQTPIVVAMSQNTSLNVTFHLPRNQSIKRLPKKTCARYKTSNTNYCMDAQMNKESVQITIESVTQIDRVATTDADNFRNFVLKTEQMNRHLFFIE